MRTTVQTPFTLTTSGVAQAAATNETMIRRLADRGVITAVRDSTGRRLFSADAIPRGKQYITKQRAVA